MTKIYVTEALTGAKRQIEYENICDSQMESAEAKDYGFNKVGSEHPAFWDNCFSKNGNGNMTEIFLMGRTQSINILHSMDEIESGLDHGVTDFHMTGRLRDRMLAELNRIQPEIMARGLNGMLFVNEKFGAPEIVPFLDEDDDMGSDITTVQRSFIDVQANLKSGLQIDGRNNVADYLRTLESRRHFNQMSLSLSSTEQ